MRAGCEPYLGDRFHKRNSEYLSTMKVLNIAMAVMKRPAGYGTAKNTPTKMVLSVSVYLRQQHHTRLTTAE